MAPAMYVGVRSLYLGARGPILPSLFHDVIVSILIVLPLHFVHFINRFLDGNLAILAEGLNFLQF